VSITSLFLARERVAITDVESLADGALVAVK